MQPVLVYLICGVVAYLLGSVANGYLIARARGVDIRRVGSGNIGATNVFRSVGKPWGLLTFVLDALKGFLSAWLLPLLARRVVGFQGGTALALFCAALAIAGHNWPLMLGFRGGKGVATTAGAVLGVAPLLVAVGLLVWAAVFVTTRYVSVASMSASILMPVFAWVVRPGGGWLLPTVLTAIGLVTVWRHRGNIRRLAAGTEHRFSFAGRAR